MAAKKVTRKELLKEPDEFITTTGQVIRFVRENPRIVTLGAIIVFIGVLAAVGINFYLKQRQLESHRLFGVAYHEYEAIINSPEPASPDAIDKVLANFEYIATNYGSLPTGEMALFYTGHLLYMKQDYKDALDRYIKVQSTSLAKKGLGLLIQYHIAMTHLALKDYEQALMIFDQLSKDINSPYRRESYSSIARIYELMGKNKEAVQAYRQYLKMFPEAPDAAFIKARIADLAVQG